MKNNKTARIVVLLLFVAIVTAVVISGTFAKYTTSTGPTAGTANVAKWSFSATGLGNAARTDNVSTDKIVSGKMAPGTTGKIGAIIDVTGCEVAIDYTVTISNITNKPTNLVFKQGNQVLTADGNGNYVATGTLTLTDIAAITEVDGHKTVDAGITFEWPYETPASGANTLADNDAADTTNGTSATAMTFSVTVVGTQSNPANS